MPETKKVDDGVYSVRRRNLMKYTMLYRQLATFIPRRLLRKYRRRRRLTMAYILASRNPDEVYGALSAACYVHSTQAAQKVPETKKVVDGVLLVR